MERCPQCSSNRVIRQKQDDFVFISCEKCGYDELQYDVYPSEKRSQREKGRYTPYQTGGGFRTRKK